MTYSKPEIAVLGDATCLVQDLTKQGSAIDGGQLNQDPAYDLDE